MLQKIKETFEKWNKDGIPLPMIKDPKTDKGSVTLTMHWIAFNVAILALAGKVTKIAGDIDYTSVLWLLTVTGGMYLGRKYQGDGKNMSLDGESK